MGSVNVPSSRLGLARALIALGFVLLQGDPAASAPLPPAGVVGTVSFNILEPPPIDVGDFGSYSLGGPIGELQLDVGATPSPFVSASGETVPFFFGRSSALVQYSVQITGPTPSVMVHVAVAGGVAGSSSPGGPPDDTFHGFALKSQWFLQDPSSATLFSEGIVTPALQGSFSDSFSHVVELEMAVNTLYRVTLIADVGVRSGSASAFIDPVFSFAPDAGEGYSFLFSEGIGNSPPVPEPASFVLLAAGLLALAAVRRRARVGVRSA